MATMKAPAVLSRNSASTVPDNRVVYFACCDGTLMLAPDTRLSPQQCGLPPTMWRRCEAVGAKEIEAVSVILARQEFEHRRKLKVQQALKELDFLKQARIGAKLRASMNYSKNDVAANQIQERQWQLREDRALAVIASELDPTHCFDPTTREAMLQMERTEQSRSPLAHVNQKPVGVLNG